MVLVFVNEYYILKKYETSKASTSSHHFAPSILLPQPPNPTPPTPLTPPTTLYPTPPLTPYRASTLSPSSPMTPGLTLAQRRSANLLRNARMFNDLGLPLINEVRKEKLGVREYIARVTILEFIIYTNSSLRSSLLAPSPSTAKSKSRSPKKAEANPAHLPKRRRLHLRPPNPPPPPPPPPHRPLNVPLPFHSNKPPLLLPHDSPVPPDPPDRRPQHWQNYHNKVPPRPPNNLR